MTPINFSNFYSLISAIPNEYKSILYTQDINALTIPEKTFVDIIENSKQVNKTLYNIQLQSQSKTDDSIERKWNLCLNLRENLNWRTIYTLPFKSTIDTYVTFNSNSYPESFQQISFLRNLN